VDNRYVGLVGGGANVSHHQQVSPNTVTGAGQQQSLGTHLLQTQSSVDDGGDICSPELINIQERCVDYPILSLALKSGNNFDT